MSKFLICVLLLLHFCILSKRERLAKGFIKVTAQSGLILREGPGTNFAKLTTLPKNSIAPIYETSSQLITIKGSRGKWILTEYQNMLGYVFSGHVLIAADKQSLEKENFDKSPITPFLVSESGKSTMIRKLVEKNSITYLGSEKAKFSKLSEDSNAKIETVSMGDEYDPKTIVKTWKNSTTIEYPDINNFHPIKSLESGKLIEGEYFLCYECCAGTVPVMAVLGNQKSFTTFASADDTDALCFPEGGDIAYNRVRYIEDSNQLLIHSKIGDCNESLLAECYKEKKTDSCKPKKFTSESFKVITNPFDEPVLTIFMNKAIPENHKELLQRGRKLVQKK